MRVPHSCVWIAATTCWILALASSASTCQSLYNVTCENGFPATPADAGLEGNLAFPVLGSPRTFALGQQLSDFLAGLNNVTADAVYTPVQHEAYHISIYYFPCVSVNRTEDVHRSLRSFRWKSIRVRLSSTCCSAELERMWSVLLCVDASSEALIRNFSTAIRQHLEQDLGPGSIPDKESSQPHRHLTVGSLTAGFDMEQIILDPRLPRPSPSIELQLDTFYFGTEVYLADDFLKPGGISNLVYLAFVAIPFVLYCCFMRLRAFPSTLAAARVVRRSLT